MTDVLPRIVAFKFSFTNDDGMREILDITSTVETLLYSKRTFGNQPSDCPKATAHMAQPELDLPAGAPCRLRVECVSEFMPPTGMIG